MVRLFESPARGGAHAIALITATLCASCAQSPTAAPRLGPPTALRVVTGDEQTGVEGAVLPVPLTVQVLDASGQGVPNVTINWTVTAGGGTLLARAFPTLTDSVGLAVVLWQLGSSLDRVQGAAAGCCNMPGVQFTAQAELPLSARISVLSGDGQGDTVTQTLTMPLVVKVRRANGTPDPGTTVGWRSLSPGGHYSPTFARTDSSGRAATIWTLGTVAGTETTAVVVGGLPPVLAFATALPGPPTRLQITPATFPLIGLIRDTLLLNANAWDQYGNVVFAPIAINARDTSIVGLHTPPYAQPWLEARHHGATWIDARIGFLRDSVPVSVLGFSSVSDGGGHTCGLSLAGDAYCWGENAAGSIGDGTTIDRPRPVLVGRGLGLQVPYTDWHTCALNASGQAYCWGLDQSGELGDGSPNYSTELHQTLPVPAAGGHLFSSIRSGRSHTCAVDIGGDAYCWGDNGIGQLGRDTLTSTCVLNAIHRCSSWPIHVAGGLKFAHVSAGPWEHSCGVTTSGAAYCWGSNGSGQLGNDSTTETCGFPAPGYACSHVPLRVEGGLIFKSTNAGNYFTCGLSVTGDGYCWGFGTTGDLGNGANVSSTMPVKVSGGLSFADVQAGCGLTTNGKVYCWGENYGSVPAPVLPNLVFGSLAGGSAHACALSTSDDLYCWSSAAYFPSGAHQGVAAWRAPRHGSGNR